MKPSATTVVNTIAEHAPNIKKLIVGRQVLTPLDLEREFGLTQGNIFQGELSLRTTFLPSPRSRLGLYYARPSTASTCAARQRIRAAASWVRRAASQAKVILKEWKKSSGAPRSGTVQNRRPPAALKCLRLQPSSPCSWAIRADCHRKKICSSPSSRSGVAIKQELKQAPPETADSPQRSPTLTADEVANAPSDSTIAPDSEKN